MSSQNSDSFCRNYVQDVFLKFDTDNSNVLNWNQLKRWLKYQIKMRPLQKRLAHIEFNRMILEADTDQNFQIDRMQLYDYCLKIQEQNNGLSMNQL